MPATVAGFHVLFSLIITLSPTLNGGRRVDDNFCLSCRSTIDLRTVDVRMILGASSCLVVGRSVRVLPISCWEGDPIWSLTGVFLSASRARCGSCLSSWAFSVCFILFGLLFLLSRLTEGSVGCLFDIRIGIQMQNREIVGLRIGGHYR